MILFKAPRLVFHSIIPRLLRVNAITLYPFIFFRQLKAEVPKEIIAHEDRHFRDILSYGPVRFYLSYLLYYLAHRAKGMPHAQAYRFNPWEVRAQDAEHEA